MALLPSCINIPAQPVNDCCCPVYDIAADYLEGDCVINNEIKYYANCDIMAGTPFVEGVSGATWREDGDGHTIVAPFNPCRTYARNEMTEYEGQLWTTNNVKVLPGPWNAAQWKPYGGGGIQTITAGTPNVTIDDTDPENVIVSVDAAPPGGITSVVEGDYIRIDDTDPQNPVISLDLEIATVEETRAAATQDKLLTAQLIEESSAIVRLTPGSQVDWDAFWTGDVDPDALGGDVLFTNPINVQVGTVRNIVIYSPTYLNYRIEFDTHYHGEIPDNDCSCCEFQGSMWLRLLAYAPDYIIVDAVAAGRPAPVTITVLPEFFPSGLTGQAYNQTVTATGGTGPYTFAVTSGSLPAGLALDPATGVISGTPTASGSVPVQITATDVNGDTGFRDYEILIAAPIPSGRFDAIGYSPEREEIVIIGNKVLISTDGFNFSENASTWFYPCKVIWDEANSLYIGAQPPNIAGNLGGAVRKSADGLDWAAVSLSPTGLNGARVFDIVYSKAQQRSYIYFRSHDNTIPNYAHFVRSSTDGFVTASAAVGLPSVSLQVEGGSLVADESDGSVILRRGSNQLFKCYDGVNWTQITATGFNTQAAMLGGMAYSEDLERLVCAADRVSDDGASWSTIVNPLISGTYGDCYRADAINRFIMANRSSPTGLSNTWVPHTVNGIGFQFSNNARFCYVDHLGAVYAVEPSTTGARNGIYRSENGIEWVKLPNA